MTVDVDGRRVREIFREVTGRRLPAGSELDVHLPLTLLQKGLVLDLDLRDGHGDVLPVVTRDVNTVVGGAAVAAATRIPVSDRLRARIEAIVGAFPDQSDLHPLTGRPLPPPRSVMTWAREPLNPGDVRNWRRLLTDENFKAALYSVTFDFLFLARLVLTDERRRAWPRRPRWSSA